MRSCVSTMSNIRSYSSRLVQGVKATIFGSDGLFSAKDFIDAAAGATEGAYVSNFAPDIKSIYGPSNALFQPGSLSGNNDPTVEVGRQAFNPDYMNFAPNVGFAWNPSRSTGLLGKFLGGLSPSEADPWMGILLVPLGALLLFIAVALILFSARRGPEPPAPQP